MEAATEDGPLHAGVESVALSVVDNAPKVRRAAKPMPREPT